MIFFAIIAARNEQEAKTGTLIKDFEAKIIDFFCYVRMSSEGERLIVKINSHVSESGIYDDFAKIYIVNTKPCIGSLLATIFSRKPRI